MGTKEGGNVACQVVGTTDVSAEHGNDVRSQSVDADYGRIFVLILDEGRNGAHADAHSANEHKRIEILPSLTNIRTTDYLALIFLGKNLTEQQARYMLALLANVYDCYLDLWSR